MKIRNKVKLDLDHVVCCAGSARYTHRMKCHKIIMIYPQPIRRHYRPKYTLITLAPVSYLRSLVVRAVHRHRTGVGSIPAGGAYS